MESVSTDMDAHTVTVTFDEEKTGLAAVVGALNEAGYVVTEEKRLE